MKTLENLVQTARFKTPCYFIKKNTKDVLSSKVHCIEISDLIEGQLEIEISPEPAELLVYYEIDMEPEWKKWPKKARKYFTKSISDWLKEGYEFVDETELMAMIAGRSAEDLKKEPAREILYLEGFTVMQMTRFANHIEIKAGREEDGKLFFSDRATHIMTFPDAAPLEQAWHERIEQYTGAMKFKIVDRTDLESKYEIVEHVDEYRRLVFVEDKEADRIDQEKKRKKIEREKQKEKEIEAKEKTNPFPNNRFMRALKDYGYSFCYFAGAPVLDISEDHEIFGEDVHPGAGDWVVHDERGLSGTYGVSHEDLSIYKIKIRKPGEHGVDYKQKPLELVLPTLELMHRFKWISFLFDHSSDVEYSNPMGHWAKPGHIDEDYRKEKEHLKNDPHLALYWLMHFGFLMDGRYDEVKSRVGGVDHEYLQDCMAFFKALEKNPDFAIDVRYRSRDRDPREYEDLFQRRRAYAIHETYSYEYASDGRGVADWWNAIRVYPKAEKYLIQRIRWLRNNLVKFDAWNDFNRLVRDEPIEDHCLMAYVQFFNPGVGDKNRLAMRFLEEMKANADVWKGETGKRFGARMIYEVHQTIADKKLLAELVGHYFQDSLSDEYAEVMSYLGKSAAPKADKEAVLKLSKVIRKNPHKTDLQLSKKSENLVEQVIQNLLDEHDKTRKHYKVLEQLVYYLLKHPVFDKREYFLKTLFHKKPHTSITFDQKQIAQCMHANDAALAMIKKLLNREESGDDTGDLLSVKEGLAMFLGPMVHQAEVFDYLNEVLLEKPFEQLHLLHRALIDKLLFGPGKNNSSSKFTEAQCTVILDTIEELYLKTSNGSTADEIESCISGCGNENAIPWLKQALARKSRLTGEVYSALSNMGERGRTELTDLLFTGHPMNGELADEMGSIVNADLHQKMLLKVKEKNDFQAAGKYMYILREFVENHSWQFELARLLFEILQNNPKADWKKLFFNDARDEIVRGTKYVLLEGAAAGIKSGKKTVIQDMFDMAADLTDEDLFSYREWTPEPEDIFEGMESSLKRLLQGNFTKSSKKKASVPKREEISAQRIPFAKIKDRTIAKENEFKLKARVWQNPETSEILYIDKSYQLHFFDGNRICRPPFKIMDILDNENFLSKGIRKDTAIYVKPHKAVAEFVRFGDKKIACYLSAFEDSHRHIGRFGVGNQLDFYLAWGFEFNHAGEADAFFRAAREAFPLDFPAASPWHAKNFGVITRKYYGSEGRMKISPFDKGEWTSHPDPFYEAPSARQIEEYNKNEAELLARGYCLHGYDFDEVFPKADTSLEGYLSNLQFTESNRYWNRITDFTDYLAEWYEGMEKIKKSDLFDMDFSVALEVQPPEKTNRTAEEKIVSLPDELKDLWNTHDAIRLRVEDDFSIEIYGPQEILDSYESDRREMNRFFDRNFSASAEKEAKARCEDAIPIAGFDGNAKKLIYFYMPKEQNYRGIPLHPRPERSDYSKPFLSAIDLFKHLFYQLSVKVRKDCRALEHFRIGDRVCRHGEKKCLRYKDKKSDKFYELIMDFDNLVLFTRYGKTGTSGKLIREDFTAKAELEKFYEKKLGQKLKKGYQ